MFMIFGMTIGILADYLQTEHLPEARSQSRASLWNSLFLVVVRSCVTLDPHKYFDTYCCCGPAAVTKVVPVVWNKPT